MRASAAKTKAWTTWDFVTGTGSDPAHWPDRSGAYFLLIPLFYTYSFTTGRFTGQELLPGLYGYCGSAYGPGGIRARVGRHCRADKTARWHIDHLTRKTGVAAVATFPDGRECDLVASLEHQGATPPIKRFGSSDCAVCASHFLKLCADPDRLSSLLPDVPAEPS
ncbi:MAG: GIY-YIG nuclease family protein [Magnetovibrionaceae bacterium]